ncbi:MAG: MBL fold metallo-hydrolase [Bacteroidetes bacterium]|nr:MBL fold metallo-hydrolase [Bacteroidota bacterium]
MALQIIPFQSGLNTCYIIRGDKGSILVDGAWPGAGSAFSRLLVKNEMIPKEIRLIVLTHGDFDHVGGAKELKELTGADIAIHENDRRNLEEGIFHWPEGVTSWGKLSRSMFRPLMMKKSEFPPVKADLVLGDNDQSLEEFGISGKIVHTPGHTFGSVSVLLNSGDAFVGCLVHNKAPFVLKPALPIYAKDISLLKESLKKVIKRGATTLYPGHGKPIPAEKMLKYLK